MGWQKTIWSTTSEKEIYVKLCHHLHTHTHTLIWVTSTKSVLTKCQLGNFFCCCLIFIYFALTIFNLNRSVFILCVSRANQHNYLFIFFFRLLNFIILQFFFITSIMQPRQCFVFLSITNQLYLKKIIKSKFQIRIEQQWQRQQTKKY